MSDPIFTPRLAAWDFRRVAERAQQELGPWVPPSQIDRGIFYLKTFYEVLLRNPDRVASLSYAISRRIDPFWHAHIAFTADYRRFNETVLNEPGGGARAAVFAEHAPLLPSVLDNPRIMTGLEANYVWTRQSAFALFCGSEPDDFCDWWPPVGDDPCTIVFTCPIETYEVGPGRGDDGSCEQKNKRRKRKKKATKKTARKRSKKRAGKGS